MSPVVRDRKLRRLSPRRGAYWAVSVPTGHRAESADASIPHGARIHSAAQARAPPMANMPSGDAEGFLCRWLRLQQNELLRPLGSTSSLGIP